MYKRCIKIDYDKIINDVKKEDQRITFNGVGLANIAYVPACAFIITRAKEPNNINRDKPDNIGKMISCLLAFNTLKLFLEICHPLDSLVKMLIEIWFSFI